MNGIEIGLRVFLSREIIQHSTLVSTHKGRSVQLSIFMLYWAGASAQTKPVIAPINLSMRQLQYVNHLSGDWFFFLYPLSFFTRQTFSLFGSATVYSMFFCGCICFLFLKSQSFPCPFPPSLSSPFKIPGKVSFLCFHCAPLSVPVFSLLSCSWYSLMCWGNAAPRGIPPPPPHS